MHLADYLYEENLLLLFAGLLARNQDVLGSSCDRPTRQKFPLCIFFFPSFTFKHMLEQFQISKSLHVFLIHLNYLPCFKDQTIFPLYAFQHEPLN